MRSLPLILLALASLLIPTAALASSPAPTSRFFEIRGLVLGDTRLDVSGKLWFDGTSLGASVGCNSIGARVSIDGDVVTIVGPAMMTEMACPGFNGDAEAILLKVIALGTFTIGDGKWTADGGSIEVVESPAPDPNNVPPDQPIPNDPSVVCAVLSPNDGPGSVNGGGAVSPPDAGSGSGSGSSGSGGSSGVTVTEPAPGTFVPIPPAAPGDSTEPAPAATACAVAGGKPGIAIDLPLRPVERQATDVVVDTARDVLIVPFAIGFGLVLLVTAGLLLRGRPTPR